MNLRKLISYVKFVIGREFLFFKNLKNKTGIDFNEYYDIKFSSLKEKASLFGKKVEVSDAFWHLHSIEELFIDEVYKINFAKEDPFIIDCGSNAGLSIIYFKRLFPSSKVIGFEADPVIYEMMQRNVSQFGFSDVEMRNQAVWIKEDTLMFNASGALGGALAVDSNVLNNSAVPVKSIRLRDIVKDKQVDLLKIDIEGAEFAVLDDCLDVMQNVENVFIEFHRAKGAQEKVGAFLLKLEEAGFRLYIKEAWNNLPHPFCSENYNPMYDLQLNVFGSKK